MAAWSKVELHEIAEADDLHISPFRGDGVTYGTPTWIWSVAVEDALYGVKSRWHQAAVRQKAGRISAAGITREVVFEPVDDGAMNDRIDEAYRAKYTKSPYLKAMISARLAPRPSGLRRGRSRTYHPINQQQTEKTGQDQ